MVQTHAGAKQRQRGAIQILQNRRETRENMKKIGKGISKKLGGENRKK
jgi:hypothetical protein